MGGRGSGGKRVGAGRKLKSALERAISGAAAPRGVVVSHPNSTAVAPIETFDPPAELQGTPAERATLTAELAFLKQAGRPDDPNPQIAEVEARLAALDSQAQALAVWHELAPHAFAARTLTPATVALFVMLCRGVAKDRALWASVEANGPNHRGLMHRVATWLKDFAIAPFGKPLYAAERETTVNPVDRFTKKARA